MSRHPVEALLRPPVELWSTLVALATALIALLAPWSLMMPPGVAYAGLAETITLALEGRFEVFTVGVSPQWDKVREIYRLGLKHGMQLAGISGVDGIYSEEEIARVKAMAIKERNRA